MGSPRLSKWLTSPMISSSNLDAIFPDMYTVIIYIYAPGPATPPSPRYGMGPIYWSHMRSSPSPPVVWWGCGTVPLPPCGVVDGSHILVPYEIFPLPPVVWWGCGTVPLPPPVVWWMGPIYWSHMRSSPSPRGVVGVWHCPPPPPVVWWGCGMVWWVCMVCMVGLVWHVWKVWYVWYVW